MYKYSVKLIDLLSERKFMGSPCTKDCSGHKAGYAWSRARGGKRAASWSPSFNKGAALGLKTNPQQAKKVQAKLRQSVLKKTSK